MQLKIYKKEYSLKYNKIYFVELCLINILIIIILKCKKHISINCQKILKLPSFY